MNRQLALLLAAFAFACSMEAKTSDQSGPTDPQLGTGGTTPRSHQPEEEFSNAAPGGTSGAAGLSARKPASSSTGGVSATSNATQRRPSSGGSFANSDSHQVGTATGGASARTNSTMQSLGSSGGRSTTNTRVAPSGASGTAESSGGARSTSAVETGDALSGLEAYLAEPRASRQAIEAQAFSQLPLTREQANRAAELLWKDYAQFITDTRRAEHNAKTIKLGELSLRYAFTTFGKKPASGRSLYISLHGGGNADASVNDQQWENQKTLYQPDEGIYLAPRAPTNTWNLWHEKHIDPMFERLITNLIVLEEVNPDRVYVMGYSAGGDGVYQLGPRMADYWAAAAVMAGHPNDASPLSLRNIGFTIHVGALDTAYDRNLLAPEWGKRLDQLQAEDPSGYAHLVQVHQGKPHWMDLEDAVAVPWMAQFTRNPQPNTVVWYQDDVPHTRFYWLAVDPEQASAKAEVRATCEGQRITLETQGLTKVKIRLSDSLLDLDRPITVMANGQEQSSSSVKRTIATLSKTLQERGDPRSIYCAELEVQVPQG
ncbi:MAG TPA: hypothetical protein VKP30_25285 [Polyangiaceae bacterium]|nr:hypothetical protein [Polyangiaceae bacterium]